MSRAPTCELCKWQATCTFSSQSNSKLASIRQLDFRKNSTVYSTDLPAEGVFVIQKGSVSLISVDRLGNSRIAQFLGPGDFLGLDALLRKHTRVFTAQCREDSSLCFIPTDAFEQFLRGNIFYLWDLLLKLDEQAHETAMEKLKLSGYSVRRRLAFATKRLAAIFPTGQMNESNREIRQWEIAQFIGTSCETVSRELKLLQSKNTQESISARRRTPGSRN